MPVSEDIFMLEHRERVSRKLAVTSSDISVRIVQLKMADQYVTRLAAARLAQSR